MTHDTNGNGKSNSSEHEPLAFLEREPTEEELLHAGEQCSHLLNSPIFNLAYRSTVEDLKSEILASEPHEQKKRDALYYENRVLNRVLWKLRSYLTAAQQVAEKRMQEEELTQYDHRARFKNPMM